MNQVHNLTSCVCWIRFNIIVPFTHRPPKLFHSFQFPEVNFRSTLQIRSQTGQPEKALEYTANAFHAGGIDTATSFYTAAEF
jgi:hypothetical protein